MEKPWMYATLEDWTLLVFIGVLAFVIAGVIESMDKELKRRILQLEKEIERITGKKLK